MKIGVVSDTHSKELPQQMIDDFKKVDLIIHAGDFCDKTVYDALAKIKEVKGVCGNMDDLDIYQRLAQREILQCGSFRIGVFHGGGAKEMLMDKVKAEFKNDKVDAIVFGHAHAPLNEKIGNVLYFNPGSPNDEVFAPFCSYGILEISDKGISGKIVKVKS